MMQSELPIKGQTFEVPSTIVTFRAVAADTGGVFSLFDCRIAPRQGAPLHQHSDDEAFLIIEGTFQFQIDNQYFQRGKDDFVFVPKNTPHTFLNMGTEEGRFLIITHPAGAHERFFAEVGELKASASASFSTQPPDIEKLVTVGRRYGFEILLPSPFGDNQI
jgi:mannose-6-phosphate isomerase-like protein (cupin superfamily)